MAAKAKEKAGFIEPMLLLRTDALPDDGGRWTYQLKLDGYRAVAFKTGGRVQLRSRNDNDFNLRYPAVVKGLATLPDETVDRRRGHRARRRRPAVVQPAAELRVVHGAGAVFRVRRA